jgi:hypothetical protein
MSPSLIRSGEASLDLLIEELAGKLQAGEAVDVAAILAANPEHADKLRPLLPTLGQELRQWIIGPNQTALIDCITFTPDSKQLVTGNADTTLLVLDLP